MDIRTLRYFLAIAQEESFSKAARILHMSQPPLSRQMKELEEELGVTLFMRNSRSVSLTEEGQLLQARAQEIVDLMEKTSQEVSQASQTITGDVYIGAGETCDFVLIAQAMAQMQQQFPQVQYRLSSGDGPEVKEQLDKGLIDFGILFGPVDPDQYHCIPFPHPQIRGFLVPAGDPLAQKTELRPMDLVRQPLIVSRQSNTLRFLSEWMKPTGQEPHIAATFSLFYNASKLAEAGMGYVLTIEGLLSRHHPDLVFIPVFPKAEVEVHFVWRKGHALTKAAAKFLEAVRIVLQPAMHSEAEFFDQGSAGQGDSME